MHSHAHHVQHARHAHAQGAPSNNTAVLTFGPVADQIAASVVNIARGHGERVRLRVPITHVIAFRYWYANGDFPPVYITGSVVSHMLGLAARWSHSVTLHRLPSGHEPQPADFFGMEPTLAPVAAPATGDAVDAAASGSPTTWPGAVRDAITQLLRNSRAVTLGATDYDRYVAFFAANATGQSRVDTRKRE